MTSTLLLLLLLLVLFFEPIATILCSILILIFSLAILIGVTNIDVGIDTEYLYVMVLLVLGGSIKGILIHSSRT